MADSALLRPAQEIDFTVRRSDRARRVRVHVHPLSGAVEVVLPARAAVGEARAAVVSLRRWIEARIAEAVAARMLVDARGETVPYLGQTLSLVREAGRSTVRRRGDELLVPDIDAHPALERFYRRRARAEIEPRLDRAVAALGTSYTALRIGAQRTRWGSCSATGTMSFNWRLLLADEKVLDYVVWHEACHLVVMDHSPRFWALLGRHVSDYREPQRWLRAHGRTLVL
jgi:predicted metal-dependent hydrolase